MSFVVVLYFTPFSNFKFDKFSKIICLIALDLCLNLSSDSCEAKHIDVGCSVYANFLTESV